MKDSFRKCVVHLLTYSFKKLNISSCHSNVMHILAFAPSGAFCFTTFLTVFITSMVDHTNEACFPPFFSDIYKQKTVSA